MTEERWFVYEWGNNAGFPDIIGWFKTKEEAEVAFGKFVSAASKETEYALCHIEKIREIHRKGDFGR